MTIDYRKNARDLLNTALTLLDETEDFAAAALVSHAVDLIENDAAPYRYEGPILSPLSRKSELGMRMVSRSCA